MHSTKRLWTPEAKARKHLKLGANTILAIMRHGCSILTATISRSFIKAKLIFERFLLSGRCQGAGEIRCEFRARTQSPLQFASVLLEPPPATRSIQSQQKPALHS